MRAGYDAIRRGAGDDAFLLGCGAPLGPRVGVVDGMRIGADVAPWLDVPRTTSTGPGYADGEPADRQRLAQHPDPVVPPPPPLAQRPGLPHAAHRAHRAEPRAVRGVGAARSACPAGMALVSDDLALLDADARAPCSTR